MRTRTPPGSFLFVSGFILICKSLDAPPRRGHIATSRRASLPLGIFIGFSNPQSLSLSVSRRALSRSIPRARNTGWCVFNTRVLV